MQDIRTIEYDFIFDEVVKSFYINNISDEELRLLCEKHLVNAFNYIITDKNESKIYTIISDELRKFLRNKMEEAVEKYFLLKEECESKNHSR